MAVAVVERFEQKPFYGLSAKIKQVAVLERMPSVEVRLHDFTIKYRLALLTWYKHVLRARVVSDMSRRSQFSLHAEW